MRPMTRSTRRLSTIVVLLATGCLLVGLSAMPFGTSSPREDEPACCDWPVRLATYSVSGRSLPELRERLDAISASRSHGGQRYGYTRWRFNLPPTKAPGCEPAALDITADIEVVLPGHDAIETLSPADREKWLRYVEALRRHEMEHVEIIDRGLDAMQGAVWALSTCDQAVATVRLHERRIHQLNEQLDTTTDHGQNGEVVFPD